MAFGQRFFLFLGVEGELACKPARSCIVGIFVQEGKRMKPWSNSEVPGSGSFIPEKRLLAAVLQRAITDFVSGDGDVKESARAWMLEDELTDSPLTFKFICEALDLDYPTLRKAIVEHAKNQSELLLAEAAM